MSIQSKSSAIDSEPQNGSDALNTEFMYYGSALNVLAPLLTEVPDRELVTKWIKRLYGPEYHSSKLREKRNRYLAAMIIGVIHDQMVGVFRNFPPDGPLLDFDQMKPDPVPAAEWELDTQWKDTLLALPDDFVPLECTAHEDVGKCTGDHELDQVLDQEFQLFLYIARPYVTLLPPKDRTKIAAWIQTLCTIHGEACSSMRGLRNDYMMVLLGYLNELRVVGPFCKLPPYDRLAPIEDALKVNKYHMITDPTTEQVDDFLAEQPLPEDGAFCYIALTGDLINCSLDPTL